MEDSFFGFDTSVPMDDDGGGQIAEPSEEEYDALNDETFGSATNGDWEEVHENLVRLTSDADGYVDTLDSGEYVPRDDNILLSRMKTNQSQDLIKTNLEINMSGMKLDDEDSGEIVGNVLCGVVQTNSRVLSSGLKEETDDETAGGSVMGYRLSSNQDNKLSEQFATPFQHRQQISDNNYYEHEFHMKEEISNIAFGLPQLPQIHLPSILQQQKMHPKICTLEDIERNMIMQQSMSKQQQTHPQQEHEVDVIAKQQKILHDILLHSSEKPPSHQNFQFENQQQLRQTQQQDMTSPKFSILYAQKGLHCPQGFVNPNQQLVPRPSNNFASNLAQHPLGNLMQQPASPRRLLHSQQLGNRFPPAFYFQQPPYPQLPPHPLLNQQAGISGNFPNQFPHPNAHLQAALNNFAMHPTYNVIRANTRAFHPGVISTQQQQIAQSRIFGQTPNQTMLLSQSTNTSNSSFNIFNTRLVQEIQQNHPLLQNSTRQCQQHQQQTIADRHCNNNNYRNNSGPNIASGTQKQNNIMRRDLASTSYNLANEEFDDYADLMSTREKHWLIGIQLSQLNTDTPYIDDYYYTVYKENRVKLSGNFCNSQAHKDNQLNHPLTQPKGHAQLILVQLGNKNGQRNGQNREHRNSESQEVKLPTYVFTGLKFENSLGKLQYGSVTAPRKIIDAEIMSSETLSTNFVSNNSAVQSGIEKTFDAIKSANSIDIKSENPALLQISNTSSEMTTANSQRKSRCILLHIETLYRILLKLDDLSNPNVIATILVRKKKESERIAALEQLENANKTLEERTVDTSNNVFMKSKFNYEIETRDVLIEKLISGLQHDKVVAMMNVRKGKILIRRIMPNIENRDIRWNVWIGVFSSLQNVIKKDRDDAEGILYSLYPEFVKQIKSANFSIIVKISSAFTLNDKKSNGFFCSKFGISSLVCLILQAENIYVENNDESLTEINKNSWRQFLHQVASSLNRTIQNQTICAAIESDSIQPIMNHIARFEDLKLDSLLALITEAKQQIN